MSSIKDLEVPIELDCPRNLVFTLNVLEKCVEKFGSLEKMLNEPLNEIASAKWLAVEMLNEDADIWNDDHEDKKSYIDEKKLGRYMHGLSGTEELVAKVQEAMLKGLPEDKVALVEETAKNLIAVQNGKMQNPSK
jgi:hypothetical protein